MARAMRNVIGAGSFLLAGMTILHLAQAGDGSIDKDGNVDLTVSVRAPAGPDQLDLMQEQLTIANRVICDATDGQVRLRTITLTQGDSQQKRSDIWWFPNDSRAHSGGVLGHGTDHIEVFGGFADDNAPVGVRTRTTMRGDVLAHEMGHLVLGLGDSYNGQTEKDGCGFGPCFDGAGQAHRNRPANFSGIDPSTGTPVPPELDTELNHTIMQEVGQQVCRRPGNGPAPFDDNPQFFVNQFCLEDDDCTLPPFPESVFGTVTGVPNGYGTPIYTECSPLPPQASELSVSLNFDPLRETGSACPQPQPGTELVIVADLSLKEGPPCGNGLYQPELGEECDPTLTSGAGAGATPATCSSIDPKFSSGNALCVNCLWDRSTCSSVCGAGGEECSGNAAGATCQDLPPNPLDSTTSRPRLGGLLACNANCTYDTTGCETSSNQLAVTTFAEAMATRSAFSPAVVMDEVGDLSGEQPSLHNIWVFTAKSGEHAWDFLFAVNAADYSTSVPPEGEPDAGTIFNPQTMGCGNGIVEAQLGEECDFAASAMLHCGSAFDPADTEARCGPNCQIEHSSCRRAEADAALCGNGQIDPGEECDGSSQQTCSDLHDQLTGPLGCHDNCTLDKSSCESGAFLPIARYTLQFDPVSQTLSTINGKDIATSDPPTLILGSETEASPYGRGLLEGQTVITGKFAESPADPVELTLRFTDVREVPQVLSQFPVWDRTTSTLKAPQGELFARVRMRARHGLTDDFLDIPQIGRCTNDSWCERTWNTETQRFEGTAHGAAHSGMSDWQVMRDDLSARAVPITVPQGRPNPDTLSDPDLVCPDPEFLGVEDFAEEPEEIVFLIDRSASMAQRDVTFERGTRYDFARAGLEAYLEFLANRGSTPPRIGVIAFGTVPTVVAGELSMLYATVDPPLAETGSTAAADNLRI